MKEREKIIVWLDKKHRLLRELMSDLVKEGWRVRVCPTTKKALKEKTLFNKASIILINPLSFYKKELDALVKFSTLCLPNEISKKIKNFIN